MKNFLLMAIILCGAFYLSYSTYAVDQGASKQPDANDQSQISYLEIDSIVRVDSIAVPDSIAPRNLTLEQDDYVAVAKRLGVDVPAIRAVVEIEAGPKHEGFFDIDKPIINFSLGQFRREAQQRGINLNKYAKSHAEVFAAPNRAKYGSTQAAQYARLNAAMSIDTIAALKATFWGMFQIGGFNWKKCGALSPQDFVRRMAESEHEQLELFANFLVSTGLDKPLRKHDWSTFARGYNGPKYAARGYHTRLAKAYRKYGGK